MDDYHKYPQVSADPNAPIFFLGLGEAIKISSEVEEEFRKYTFEKVLMNEDSLNKVDLLDHGFVRLVDYMGNDLSIVRAARVSYDAAWRAGEDTKSDEKLIRYLWRNKHTSPFEAVTVTFEIQAPIFVFRQWHRHRTQSYNEVSARYTELPEIFYVPDVHAIGVQSKNNKQAREFVELDADDIDNYCIKIDVDIYKRQCAGAFATYKYLLGKGWPRELARMVLPFSTYSHMFATANLLNWFRFIDLRLHEHAQYEIRVYAGVILDMLSTICPVACKAFEENRNG